MRTTNIFKWGLGLVVIIGLGLVSYKTFAHVQKNNKSNIDELAYHLDTTQNILEEKEPGADISMTMDCNATDDNIQEIKSLLKESRIDASFSNIERDENGKITSIKIELTDDNNGKAINQISSYKPISNISFGRKNGILFISQDGNSLTQGFSFINGSSPFFANDSLFEKQFGMLKKFNLQDFFNNSSPGIGFNGSTIDFDELQKQMLEEMNAIGNSRQFSFIDDPDTHKLIIIDGKESDFETLDKLANENKILAVDALKPETAKSIYGDKAKDGALIISTK